MAMIRSMGQLAPLVDTGSRAGPWAPEVYMQAPIPYATGVTQADVAAPPVATPDAESSPWLLLGGLGLLGYLFLK